MKVISADEAASIVQSGDSILVSGSGGGHGVPELILEALEKRFLATAAPRHLCLIHAVGIGDRALKGAARFRHPGMLKRSITGALIDSPPLINVTDPVILSTMVDGVILVVHGGKSTRGIAQRARQDLSSVGAKIFGVVLNNVDMRREGYKDYYYYDRYYSDYGQEGDKRRS